MFLFTAVATCLGAAAMAQPITGVWKGKVDNKRVELKFVQLGDSIKGTAYYPGLLKDYRRYSIRGYFDPLDNSIVWWNDVQLHPAVSAKTNERQLIAADYSCPGGTRMFLTSDPQKKDAVKVDVTKVPRSAFVDEWDYVLDNYQLGANDPKIIDSISLVAYKKPVVTASPSLDTSREKAAIKKPGAERLPLEFLDKKDLATNKGEVNKPTEQKQTPQPQTMPAKPPFEKKESVMDRPVRLPANNQEKFTFRKKEFAIEIPLRGDSIELRFYDNAEVDGDSISLFLNNKLLAEHIRLTGFAHVIWLAVADLNADNELVMVAENLGSIPPNTAYLMALVGGYKYDAQIVSTEETSAVIRLKKE